MSAQVPLILLTIGTALGALALFAPARAPAAPKVSAFIAPLEPAPQWPMCVDPRAAGCDATARVDLAEALAALDSAWAAAVLRQAIDDEPDPAVRAAIAAGLSRSSNQSEVT